MNKTLFFLVWISVALFVNPMANKLVPSFLDGSVNFVETGTIQANPFFSYDVSIAKAKGSSSSTKY